MNALKEIALKARYLPADTHYQFDVEIRTSIKTARDDIKELFNLLEMLEEKQ